MSRKLLLFLLIVTFFGANEVCAQRFEVSPYFGYRWGGRLSDGSYQNVGPYVVSLEFDSGIMYGLSAGYRVQPKWLIEAFADRQTTTLKLVNQTAGTSQNLSDGDIDYLMGGISVLLFDPELKLQPFFSFYVGGAHIAADNANMESQWFSAVGFGLGARYFVTDHIGFRAQIRGMSAIITDEAKYFCDKTDPTKCLEIPKDTWMGQMDLSAGLIVAF